MSQRAAPGVDLILKHLARELIARAGGLDAAAVVCRVGRTRLSEYQSVNSDAYMPVDIAARLEEIAEEPLITAELARRAGFQLAPPEACVDGDLHERIGDVHTAAGLFQREVWAAMRDGRITADEAPDLIRKLDELDREGAEARASLIRIMKGAA